MEANLGHQLGNLSWPLPEDLDEATLESLLYPPVERKLVEERPQIPFKTIHKELRRKGVTLQLLWGEYKQDYPDGYQNSQFCNLYRQWAKQLDVVMRQDHKAGEKVFVDYAGQTVPITDPQTGRLTGIVLGLRGSGRLGLFQRPDT